MAPDPERFRREERLFHEALAQTPAMREQYIAQAAAGDQRLANSVRRLIERAEQVSEPAMFTGLPLVSRSGAGGMGDRNGDDPDAEQRQRLIGAAVGPFHIVSVLGEGGFGCVYLAQQAEPIRRQVALKIVRPGCESRQIIARFESERQALALMEHPNIARVFDAGRTGPEFGSRPYFAMELVNGQPITAYCQQRGLSIEQRLALFTTVCHAVQHAHQKGVIHRDLKPSNILVSEIDGIATPKVIDFGIAKALQLVDSVGGADGAARFRLTERTFVTEAQQMLGTPQYMSPEQADGDVHSIDTRSDIYSLGVILYELLTGSTPVDPEELRAAPYSRMQQMIREQKIERPSTRLRRSSGSASRAELGVLESSRPHTSMPNDARSAAPAQPSLRSPPSKIRALRGDLDWITLKALEHERDRRYSSAAAFAEDIRRHLQHEPVAAGPPGAAYRVRKFVRRHRVGAAAATLVALTLIVGVVVVIAAMLRVRESAGEAMTINQFMSDVLTSASPHNRGAEVRLTEVLRAASATASQRFAGHPELEAQVRDLLGRVWLNLSLGDEAADEFKRAAELKEAMYGLADERSLEQHTVYAQALLFQERTNECDQALARIMPHIERTLPPDHVAALRAQWLRAGILMRRRELDEADRILLDLRERMTSGNGDELLHAQVLDGLLNIRRIRFDLMGSERPSAESIDEIEAMATEVAQVARRSPLSEIAELRARLMLARVKLLRGDAAGAAALCRELLEETRDKFGDCHVQRNLMMSVLANALLELDEAPAAADVHLELIECLRTMDRAKIALVARISDGLPFLDRGGRWQEGEALAREFVRELELLGGGHGEMAFDAEVYIARFISLQERFEEAEAMFQSLLPREDEAAHPQSRARIHAFYGSHLRRQGQYAEAERRLMVAAERLDDIRGGTTIANRDDLIAEFIALYEAMGRPGKAAEYQRLRDEVRNRASE